MIEKFRTGPKEIMVRHKEHPGICAFGSTMEIALARLHALHIHSGIQVILA